MKLPLPLGEWLISQGDVRFEDCSAGESGRLPTHCESGWNVCALDLVPAPGSGWQGSNFPILSPADGSVTSVAKTEEGGNIVQIEHGDGGPVSLFAHLSNVTVRLTDPPQAVAQGQIIGYAGSTGTRANGIHLHFTVLKGRQTGGCQYLDGIDGNFDLRRYQLVYSSNLALGEIDPERLVVAANTASYGGVSSQLASAPVWTGLPINVDFASQVRLLGFDLSQTQRTATVNLYWQSLAPVSEAYSVFVHVVDPRTSSIVAQRDYALGGNRRVTLWQPDDIVSDAIALDISQVPPGDYLLGIGLYNPSSGRRLTAHYGSGGPVADGWVPLARRLEIASPGRPAFSILHPLNVNFGGKVELLGFSLNQTDSTAALTLKWKSLAAAGQAYLVFVHVFNAENGALAQFDYQAGNGYSTALWQTGEIVSDLVNMNFSSLPPGNYTLGVGLYDPGTGERLVASASSGALIPNSWVALTQLLRVAGSPIATP